MPILQERVVEILTLAIRAQDEKIEIRKRIVPELQHIASVIEDPEIKKTVENAIRFILQLTEIDIQEMRNLERERAHFNPTRMKQNEYMRNAYHRRKNRDKLRRDPLDLGINEPQSNELPRQNNEHSRQNSCQNNVANIVEVPFLANIEAEEKRLGLNSDADELKQKFGPDFRPLPARIGLKRH